MKMTSLSSTSAPGQKEYRRRVWAWTMYDWANSAFATTILAAVLPVYFSQVAGSTLPSATVATTYWSTGLSISLLIIALLSPILGTISDIMRGKKRFLALFAGIGIISTALLVFVGTGDWILASILGILGRIGFNGANTFYDALLPHVATPDDQDRVSARGYAMGYLGGGLLLAVNVVMIQLLPGTWGPRLSFLSVAIWWAIFSIPLFRYVPEPPAAAAVRKAGENVFVLSFQRLSETLRDMRRYGELFKMLVAFLIYNDGIGTIIGVAAIYGAELGFGSVELVLALLLVQFVGIPYALIFGRLPSPAEKRRPTFLAFILFNLLALPIVGITSARLLPGDVSGSPPGAFPSTENAIGQGLFAASAPELSVRYTGRWQDEIIPAQQMGLSDELIARSTQESGAAYELSYYGQNVRLTYRRGPAQGIWAVYLDGQPALDADTAQPLMVDGYSATERYDATTIIKATSPGLHTIRLVNTGERSAFSQGIGFTLLQIEVLPGLRQSNLAIIIGLILALELFGVLFSLLLGKSLLSRLAQGLDTKRSILLSLAIYSVVAIWGYFLDSVVEFWMLAWMVAVVQGGSQALSRSLYAAMSPAAKSGEFFGLFGIMEKFSAIIGPLLFAAAGALFGSSRPAVLSLIVIFFLGGFLLTRVNVEEGKRMARLEDARLLKEVADVQ